MIAQGGAMTIQPVRRISTAFQRPVTIIILILVGIPLFFFLGFIPGALQARHAREELSRKAAEVEVIREQLTRTQLQHKLARLHGTLGLVMYEANRNNFANAAADATQFFDGLRAALSNKRLPEIANRAELESILAERDAISSDVARADAGVKAKLSDLYVRFDQAISLADDVPTR